MQKSFVTHFLKYHAMFTLKADSRIFKCFKKMQFQKTTILHVLSLVKLEFFEKKKLFPNQVDLFMLQPPMVRYPLSYLPFQNSRTHLLRSPFTVGTRRTFSPQVILTAWGTHLTQPNRHPRILPASDTSPAVQFEPVPRRVRLTVSLGWAAPVGTLIYLGKIAKNSLCRPDESTFSV